MSISARKRAAETLHASSARSALIATSCPVLRCSATYTWLSTGGPGSSSRSKRYAQKKRATFLPRVSSPRSTSWRSSITATRSEERRVGKECRSRGAPDDLKQETKQEV